MGTKFLGLTSLLMLGCMSNTPEPQIEYRLVDDQIPQGVERYCFEEPMVVKVEEPAGLDVEGKWYRPNHVAVRMVREGKWRTCKKPSE